MSKKSQLKIPKDGNDIKAWMELAFNEENKGQIEKLSKEELSKYILAHGVQNGTKSSPKMMVIYIKMHLAGQIEGVKNLYEGENFAEFKVPRLKKELAKLGVLPEGTYFELATKLLETDVFKNLIKNRNLFAGQKEGSGQQQQQQQQNQQKTVVDGEMLAKEILKLGEQGNYEGILSILGQNITQKSTVGEMKKAYLKISLIIHPDKLQQFPDAKKAFQELVGAYERLSRPQDFQKNLGSKQTTQTTIKRSNQGCYRTELACPRCKVQWNTQLDGNPEFSYTLMMTGLKTYHCSTCLLEFGCISAIHKCPFCKKTFEYSPDDFHRKVKCGNQGCNREFGFYEDHINERTMKEVREQVLLELEQRMKKDEAKQRRAKMHQRRNQVSSEEEKQQQEKAFLVGLQDLCPRCGIHLTDLEEDVDQFKHLRECNDDYKIQEYKKKKEQEKKQKEIQENLKNKQGNIQNEAVFNAFGGQNSMLWMLTIDQLKKQCQISGLDDSGSKEELIAKLAEHRKDQRAIGGGDDANSNNNNKNGVNINNIPKNLYAMSEQAIRGVMVAQGLNPDKYKSKQGMINALEKMKYGLDKNEDKLMLQADPNAKANQSKNENKNEDSDESEQENEGDDSEYEQPNLDAILEKKQKKKLKQKWNNLKFSEDDQKQDHINEQNNNNDEKRKCPYNESDDDEGSSKKKVQKKRLQKLKKK